MYILKLLWLLVVKNFVKNVLYLVIAHVIYAKRENSA